MSCKTSKEVIKDQKETCTSIWEINVSDNYEFIIFKLLSKFMASRNLIFLIKLSSTDHPRQEKIFLDLTNSIASNN